MARRCRDAMRTWLLGTLRRVLGMFVDWSMELPVSVALQKALRSKRRQLDHADVWPTSTLYF